eukprot:2903098-Rhodomonas_salina.1
MRDGYPSRILLACDALASCPIFLCNATLWKGVAEETERELKDLRNLIQSGGGRPRKGKEERAGWEEEEEEEGVMSGEREARVERSSGRGEE